jgi:site-specific recombinase XerD
MGHGPTHPGSPVERTRIEVDEVGQSARCRSGTSMTCGSTSPGQPRTRPRRLSRRTRTTLRGDDFLLPGQAGRRLSRKRIDEVIKACARGAGVRGGHVSAHDLRRAFAREFIRNGGDLESLRQLLGHTSYAMVRRYSELAADVVAEAHGRASPGDHLRL